MKDAFFTTSDGVKLHYLVGGAGQIVLFIPGWTMPAEIWQPQLEYFSPDYCVVALDPRSQGSSANLRREITPQGAHKTTRS